MRIHRLEVQAFGPFADRQTVDFDELSAHGLFLLNGPTGAGKTSVLDAICFALYGQVPGARHEGKRLRSDHAGTGVAPEVVCEFSASGRRFEVTRSPQWLRPSKRANGSGMTTEQARTLLRERIDGEWVQKSARNDEAGAEITALLGMDREQFTKVVLLPQGDFAAFLRSPAAERLDLLQQLFGTERFELVEKRLAADAAEAKAACTDAEAGLAQLRRRALGEVLRHAEPEEAAELEAMVAGTVPDGELLAGFRTALSGKVEAAERELGAATEEHTELRGRCEVLAARHDRGKKLGGLEQSEAELAAARQDHDDALRRLASHRSAELLVPVMSAQQEAAARESQAAQAAAEASAKVLQHDLAARYLAGGPVVPADGALFPPEWTAGQDTAGLLSLELLSAAAGRARAEAGRVEAALPDEQRQLRKTEDLGSKRQAIRAREAEQAELTGQLQRLAAGIEAARTLHEETAAAASALDQRRARAEAAAALVRIIEEYRGCRERVQARTQDRDAARAEHLRLKEEWLRLMQRRLEQAAAELAATLETGVDCPVCGSMEHPRPAKAADGALIRPEDEEAAQAAQQRAESVLEQAGAALAEAERELAGLAAQGGTGMLAEAVEQSELAAAEQAEAADAARRLEESAAALADMQREQAELATASQDNEVELARLHTAEASLADEIKDAAAKLELLREGYPSLADRAADLRQALALYDACTAELHRHGSARDESARAERSLAAAVEQSVFDDLEQARAALLDDDIRTGLEEFCERYAMDRQRIRILRESADIETALAERAQGLAVPSEADLEQLQGQLAQLSGAIRNADVQLGLLRASVLQLDACAGELARELDAAVPLRDRFERLQGLADSARGNGENSYRMTLNTYVLAARLEQVAIAASERLSAMTDGRYTLVYSDSLAARGRKSGLGLHVTDEWTGHQRDTATLSGGESFMASLALALGLADVVQQEAGGVDIETLFVDEGFGSLDDQALEQVMDALEGLRDGGRVVGLVSHVAEMKLRVGAQLQVVKGRNGSTLKFAAIEAPAA